MTETTTQEFSGTLVVSVDYTRTIASLIEEAGFDYQYVDLDSDDFPRAGEGEVTYQVEELHLNHDITDRELFQGLEERGQEFADPHIALSVACQHLNEQREYPLVILFKDSSGQLWSLILGEDAGLRELDVHRVYLEDDWDSSSRFLVVRKSR